MPAPHARGRGRRTINEINMVPFIDVMLVLLIIFMVTAPLITPSQINLPSVGQADRQPERFVQVLVDAQGRLQVQGSGGGTGTGSQGPQAATLANLVAQVRALQNSNSATPVVISADKAVAYEVVVKVMDTLQRAGVARVGLSVQTLP